MVKIMGGISWHECEVCGWITFSFYNPFKETIEERGACDCTDEDFTDMLIEREAEDDGSHDGSTDIFYRNTDLVEAQ
jgi:hypothetical protein